MSYIPFESEVQVVNTVDVLEEPWQLDAYGRLRTSNVKTLFESQLTKSMQDRLWYKIIDGNATINYLNNQSALEMSVTDTSGDRVIRQSKIYTSASLGKSLLVFVSANFNGLESGITKRVGYFDDENGIFFQIRNNLIELVLRSKASGTVNEIIVSQNNWNIDSLDGTGNSTITLDVTKDQIFAFDIEWMGTGKVRAGIMIDGKMLYVHEFKFANQTNEVYMSTATLPVRYEIVNIDGISAGTLKQIASAVMSEGEDTNFLSEYAISNEIAPKQINDSLTPIMSIRPKTILNNGNKNRISTFLSEAEIYTNLSDVYFEIRIDNVISNGYWNDVDSNNSTMEYDYSGDVSTGGIIISKGYIKSNEVYRINNDKILKHILTTNFDSTSSSTLTLLAKSLTSTNTDIYVTFSWKEED